MSSVLYKNNLRAKEVMPIRLVRAACLFLDYDYIGGNRMVNSVNVAPPQGNFAARTASQRTGLRAARDIAPSAMQPSVNVDISEMGRSMASTMFAERNSIDALGLNLQEFTEKELHEALTEEALQRKAWEAKTEYILSLPEDARNFMSRTMFFFFAPDRHLGPGAHTTENVPMAKLGYQLLDVLDLRQSDTANFISLGNKYAELRQSLTEQYSGEELERRLGELSTAFDLSVTYLADRRAWQVWKRLSFESLLMQVHNQTLAQGRESHLFEGGKKEIPSGAETQRIVETFAEALQQSTRFFAEMMREFIVENGILDPAKDYTRVQTLLRGADPPQGGLTFDEMTSLREIMSRPLMDTASGSHTGTWIIRGETTFDQLARAFPNLMSQA
jgi:hypothetical protein